MSLKDKVVLVTGGGSGIGADAARAFYKAGAKIVLNGRREDLLSQTAQNIDPTGEKVTFVAGDIGRIQTCQTVVKTAERFGSVDILLNNAGFFQPKPFLEHTEADLENYLNLLRGYFFMSQAAIAQMQEGGGGAIVNIGSMWANHAIAPAVVETPLFDTILTAEQLASFNSFHPLGRNGQVRDTTAAILFLADDEFSSWITGVVLPIDGGVTAGRN